MVGHAGGACQAECLKLFLQSACECGTVNNMKRRRGYTPQEAAETLTEWIQRRRMTQAAFIRWLSEPEQGSVTISPQYFNQMITGQRPPGQKFKDIFKQITGVTLLDGLVEERKTKGGE